MRKTILATVAAAGLAAVSLGGLNAQGAPAPGAIDLSAVQAGDYTTDPSHSLVAWEVSHLGFNDYFGIFGDISGTLSIDPANVEAAALDVTIPIASVTVPSEGLKGHLMRPGQDGGAPDFFGPEPEAARFVSTAVHKTGDTSAEIMGELTLNGVTKPVTIQAELSGMGKNAMNQNTTLGFHGVTTIKRSDWNIAWGIPFGISDEVEMKISVAFEK